MSQENVRLLYDAWNRGDLEAALELMHPEIKIDYTAGAFPGIDETYEGHEGAKKYCRDLREPWRSLTMRVEALHETGDKVVTVFAFEKAERASWFAVGLGTCSRLPTDSSRDSTHTETRTRPSKPPGCGSRSAEPGLLAV
jgi:SnoaL-like protein